MEKAVTVVAVTYMNCYRQMKNKGHPKLVVKKINNKYIIREDERDEREKKL